MRLIDVDALCERFEEECPGDCLSCDYCCATNGQLFCGLIASTPVVDAEPVRHGRWIQSKTVPSYHSCSYCKRAHNMPKSCNVYVLPYYCMDCGAKMDLEG